MTDDEIKKVIERASEILVPMNPKGYVTRTIRAIEQLDAELGWPRYGSLLFVALAKGRLDAAYRANLARRHAA